MSNAAVNVYERAFENWLRDNRIWYIPIEQRKRAAFERAKIKSFDFLLYPSKPSKPDQIIIAEVKGRKFKGISFAKLAGFECWVTADDVDGLVRWQLIFGDGHIAVFVFAYRIEKIDVDFDGREIFDFDGDMFIFFAVKLDDYRTFMKLRSPKWKTVTLPADKFRQCSVQIEELLL